MLEFNEIQELLKQINRSNITEFKLKKEDFEISIKTDKLYKKVKSESETKGGNIMMTPQQMPFPQQMPPMPMAPANQPTATPSEPPKQESAKKDKSEDTATNYVEVRSPMVGTFYRSSSPDKPPFVKVGDKIEVGSVVCIVEAMKLFNEIESEVSGTVVKVMVEDAQPVEYDQVLYMVDPS